MIQNDLAAQQCKIAKLIETPDQLQECVNECSNAPFLYYDSETTGLYTFKGHRIGGMGFKTPGNQGWYLPMRHEYHNHKIALDVCIRAMKDIFDKAPQTVAHNAKFDLEMLRVDGIVPKGWTHDTMIMGALDDENSRKSLEAVAIRLGLLDWGKANSWKEAFKKVRESIAKQTNRKVKEVRFTETPLHMLADYCVQDIFYTEQISNKLLHTMQDYHGPAGGNVYETECQMIHVFLEMEKNGVYIDAAHLETAYDDFTEELEELQAKIDRAACKHIDISKNGQILDLLYLDFNIPIPSVTKSGVPSVDKFALEAIEGESEIVSDILSWRAIEKLRGTYTKQLIEKTDSNGWLHPSFVSIGPVTGRTASKVPNLQNVSKNSKIRNGFKIVPRGNVDVARALLDYGQVELRMLAKITMDENLVTAYKTGQDLHQGTADFVFGPDYKKNGKTGRDIAKMINFGISFGLTPMGLARRAGIDIAEAERAYKRHSEFFPGITGHSQELWEAMAQDSQNSLQNVFGRKRRMPDISSEDIILAGRAQRQSIASEIQGSAADLNKQALVRTHHRIQRDGLPAWICLSIHDELGVDIEKKHFDEVSKLILEDMENFPYFNPVPIVADIERSDTTWAEKKKYIISKN